MHPRRAIATCLASRVAASDSPPMTTAVRPSTDEDRHDARVEASALQQHVQHELVSVRRRVVQVARTTQEAAIAGRILPKIEGLSCFSPFTTCPPGGFLAPFVLRLCWAVKSTQTLAFLSPLHLIQQVLPWRWLTLTLLGGSPAAAAAPMAAVAASGAAGGPRTSPIVRLRPAQAIRTAHEPREHVSGDIGCAAGSVWSGGGARPVREPLRPEWRRIGPQRVHGGRGDNHALERLRAREIRAAAGVSRPSRCRAGETPQRSRFRSSALPAARQHVTGHA